MANNLPTITYQEILKHLEEQMAQNEYTSEQEKALTNFFSFTDSPYAKQKFFYTYTEKKYGEISEEVHYRYEPLKPDSKKFPQAVQTTVSAIKKYAEQKGYMHIYSDFIALPNVAPNVAEQELIDYGVFDIAEYRAEDLEKSLNAMVAFCQNKDEIIRAKYAAIVQLVYGRHWEELDSFVKLSKDITNAKRIGDVPLFGESDLSNLHEAYHKLLPASAPVLAADK